MDNKRTYTPILTDAPLAPVSGVAISFLSDRRIAHAKITILELEDDTYHIYTDDQGRFGTILWPIGKPITLQLEKPGSWFTGYRTVQSATIIVPEEGINDPNPFNNITFQVPSNIAITIMKRAMGVTEDPQSCHIAATITPPGKTLEDLPQGVEDVEVSLFPDCNVKPFYFGIVPISKKTNPFTRKRKRTSLDGGIAYINVPEGDYVLTAKKAGVKFTEVMIRARKGVLVNASPPRGPIVTQDL